MKLNKITYSARPHIKRDRQVTAAKLRHMYKFISVQENKKIHLFIYGKWRLHTLQQKEDILTAILACWCLLTCREGVSWLKEGVMTGRDVNAATEGATGITLCFSCVTPITPLLPFNFICEDLKLDILPSITCTAITSLVQTRHLTYWTSLMMSIQITS